MTADLGLQTRNFLFNFFFFNLALDSVLLRTEIEKSLCNISPMENGEVDRETAGLSNQTLSHPIFYIKIHKSRKKEKRVPTQQSNTETALRECFLSFPAAMENNDNKSCQLLLFIFF